MATEAHGEVQAAEAANESLGAQPDADEAATPYAQHITHGDDVTTIEFRGATFTFPTSRAKWRTTAMMFFQDGFALGDDMLIFKGVKEFLGAKQWDALNAAAPTMGDFWQFWPILAEAAGFVRLRKGEV